MIYRLFRWFVWSVAFSLLPFVGLLLFRGISARAWPGLDPVLGSGQLLLTCVALLAGGLKELSGMPNELRTGLRDFMTAASVVFVVFVAMTYGFLAHEILAMAAPDPSYQAMIAGMSLVFLVMSLSITAMAILVSSPSVVSEPQIQEANQPTPIGKEGR